MFPISEFLRRLTVLLAIAGLIWGGAYVASPLVERGPVLCTFRVVSGKSCPTCGMTRATCALARGHWREAMRHHPLVVPFWVAMIALIWVHRGATASRQREPWRRVSLYVFLCVLFAATVFRVIEWIPSG